MPRVRYVVVNGQMVEAFEGTPQWDESEMYADSQAGLGLKFKASTGSGSGTAFYFIFYCSVFRTRIHEFKQVSSGWLSAAYMTMKDSPPPPGEEVEILPGEKVINEESQEKEDVVVVGDSENFKANMLMPSGGNEIKPSMGIEATSMPVTSRPTEAAKESIKSCTSAKKDNAQATCGDPLAVYAAGRGKGDLDESEQRRVKQELAEDLEKDDIALCLKSESREDYNKCMENLKETDDVQDELFSGLDDKVKEAKKKRAKDDAAVDAVGDIFRSCMEEAESDEEKEECKKEIKERSEIAGITEDEDDVILKYKRNVVAESARACDASKRSECVHQAKEELVKLGLKRRAFGVVKKLADLKEAAEAFAECQEVSTADGVDATCIAAAKSTLEDLSGSTEIWSDEIQAKVQELGQALTEGREILIRKLKQVLVEAVSSAATCSDAFLDRIIDRVMGVARNFTVPGSDRERDVTDKNCRVTFGKARYFCKVSTEDMDESETEQLSDDISEDLTTAEITVRRLGGERRLSETITETYADQEVEETASTSSSTDPTTTNTITTTSETEETTTTTEESTMPDGQTTSGGTENPTGANAAVGDEAGSRRWRWQDRTSHVNWLRLASFFPGKTGGRGVFAHPEAENFGVAMMRPLSYDLNILLSCGGGSSEPDLLGF
eukprot:s1023_g30.t1